MKIHRFERTQRLPVSRETAWGFFADAANLAAITPPWMGFRVTSPLPERVYAGMIVTYRVKPLAGVPITWMTEITHLREPEMFVDEQRVGPYRIWHHEHHFAEVDGGVEVRDVVTYVLRAGTAAAHPVLVRPRLEEIFDYRARVLEERFGRMP